MKRFTMMTICLFVLACLAATTAWATSPHFVNDSASVSSTTGFLTVSWKEAGLGNNQNIDYTLSATETAGYDCINGGGNHPSATNKATVTGAVSASGQFNSGNNGQITESLTVGNPPPGPGNFSCPSGQTLVLGCVSYTDVSLEDTTNSLFAPGISGTFSATLISVKKGATCP